MGLLPEYLELFISQNMSKENLKLECQIEDKSHIKKVTLVWLPQNQRVLPTNKFLQPTSTPVANSHGYYNTPSRRWRNYQRAQSWRQPIFPAAEDTKSMTQSVTTVHQVSDHDKSDNVNNMCDMKENVSLASPGNEHSKSVIKRADTSHIYITDESSELIELDPVISVSASPAYCAQTVLATPDNCSKTHSSTAIGHIHIADESNGVTCLPDVNFLNAKSSVCTVPHVESANFSQPDVKEDSLIFQKQLTSKLTVAEQQSMCNSEHSELHQQNVTMVTDNNSTTLTDMSNYDHLVFDKITHVGCHGLNQYRAKYKNIIVYKNITYKEASYVCASDYGLFRFYYKHNLDSMNKGLDCTEDFYSRNYQPLLLQEMHQMLVQHLKEHKIKVYFNQ